MSQYLTTKIISVDLDWAYEQSDHASVSVELILNEEVKMGPGLIKVNALILDDPVSLARAKLELSEMLKQIPENWNPYENWNF